MLKISKLADYAIMVMSNLAEHKDTFLSAADIATSTKISETTVSKLLKLLGKYNLVDSQRGATGGYQLSRTSNAISLAHIIAAIDGEIALTECDKSNGYCNLAANCTVSSNWQRISRTIRDALMDVSLADMLQPLPGTMIKIDFKRRWKA